MIICKVVILSSMNLFAIAAQWALKILAQSREVTIQAGGDEIGKHQSRIAPGKLFRCATFTWTFGIAIVSGSEGLRADSITTVNLTTSDLVYDPFSDMIYASVPSTVGVPRGNSINRSIRTRVR